MPRVPLLPTLVVLIAVAIMVRLGFWQLDRLSQKQAMVARYTAMQADSTPRAFPTDPGVSPAGFSRVALACAAGGPSQAESGRSGTGQSGWAHVAKCAAQNGAAVRVVLGWSRRPDPVIWRGGQVVGIYVPKDGGGVIFADPPLAGLQANAKPDPRDLPNNHLAYAVQWFLFAGVALVIYGLALRKRLGAA